MQLAPEKLTDLGFLQPRISSNLIPCRVVVGSGIEVLNLNWVLMFFRYFRSYLDFELKRDSWIVQVISEMFGYTEKRQLLQMFCAVTFFHSSEFILAVLNHGRSNVTLESLLISKYYVLAMLFSLGEYLVELYFFPGLKMYWWVSNSGLVMVVVGEILRKLAIITAGKAFTHLIKRRREEHHNLVTYGVYRLVRHPGYTGFLIWSVGTQIMLCNPISTIVFSAVVWHFFATRIPYEEYYLRSFFGVQYEGYAARVPSGIPFVK